MPRSFLLCLLFIGPLLAGVAWAQDGPAGSPFAPSPDTTLAPGAPTDTVALDAEKEQRIRALLRLTGAADLGQQVMARTMSAMQQHHPQVPSQWWARFAREARADTLVDLIVPVYARHFTCEEIDGLIAFYQTPRGQKLVEQMPAIMHESMSVGKQRGQRLARRVRRALEADDYVDA